MAFFILCFLFFVVSSATECDRCLHNTTVAYFTDESALTRGACGYGSLALGFNNKFLVGGASCIYNDGAACGSCFKMRCKNQTSCGSQWIRVFLFDLNIDDRFGFVLSKSAFEALVNDKAQHHISKKGFPHIEYKRVPCDFSSQNLAVRVKEDSNPYFLSINFLYQGGQTEIVGVDVAEGSSSNWNALYRDYGAVWSIQKSLQGNLRFRLTVTAGFSSKAVLTQPIPLVQTQTGTIYDTGIQIQDIAKERCDECAVDNGKGMFPMERD